MVFNEAATSAQRSITRIAAPRRADTTALQRLATKLTAVDAYKLFRHLHKVVAEQITWLNGEHWHTSTTGTLATGEPSEQLVDQFDSKLQMCHLLWLPREWAWKGLLVQYPAVHHRGVDKVPADAPPKLLRWPPNIVVRPLLVGEIDTAHVGSVANDDLGAGYGHLGAIHSPG